MSNNKQNVSYFFPFSCYKNIVIFIWVSLLFFLFRVTFYLSFHFLFFCSFVVVVVVIHLSSFFDIHCSVSYSYSVIFLNDKHTDCTFILSSILFFLKNKQRKKEKALNKSIRIHFNKIKIKTIRKTHVTRHIWLDLLKLRPIKRREVHVRRTRNSMSNALLVNGGGGDLGINSTKRSRISFTEVIAGGNRLQIGSEERRGIHYWASFQRGDPSDNHYTS